MEYLKFRNKIKTNLFTLVDVKKHFPKEKDQDIRVQLSRFKKRGLIYSFKRGIYCFDLQKIDEFELANKLYQPSYISLETALHYYGIIPNIPQQTTSVNITTLKEFKLDYGVFIYHKIKKELFWGYNGQQRANGKGYFLIADAEKALLDFFYLRKIKKTADLRIDFSKINKSKYKNYLKHFPNWIKEIKIK